MRWSRVAPIVAAVVVLVAAGVTYDLVIPVTHTQRARLAHLVVGAPAGFKSKPDNAAAVDASDNPFTGVQNAAKHSPNATGSYAIQWSTVKSANDVDELLVSLLPSRTAAASVLAEAKKDYTESASFSSDGYTRKGTFPVAGVPGVTTGLYTSTTAGNPPVAVAVFQVGRVVTVVFGSQTGGSTPAESATKTLAANEYHHLAAVEPGFSLTYQTRPLVATIVYAVISVAAAGVVATLVVLLFWQRRRAAQKEAARQEARRRAQRMYHRQRELGELPGHRGTAAAPNGGGETAEDGRGEAPADAGEGGAPAEDGTAEAPAEVAEGGTPAEDGTAETPAEVAEGGAPAEDGRAESPAEVGEGGAPAEDGTAETPAGGLGPS